MNEEKNFNEENEEVEAVTNEVPAEEVSDEAVNAEETPEDTAAEETPIETLAEDAPILEDTSAETTDTIDAVDAAVEETIIEAAAADSEESVLNEQTTEQTDEFGVAENQVAAENVAVTKKKNVGAIVAVAAVIVVVAAIIVALITLSPMLFNKYNRQGYVNISGQTVGEVAEQSGMELEDFLDEFGLPKDMPANTTEAAAYNNIPFSKMAQTYGRTTDEFREMLKLPAEVVDDTPWGEAINQATLGAYVGEDYIEEFKEYYGLGEEVTADTLWGEVRQQVEEKQKQERIESEKQAKQAEKDADKSKDDESSDNNSDNAAEEPAAEASPEATAAAE